jgi:hypothetical protein
VHTGRSSAGIDGHDFNIGSDPIQDVDALAARLAEIRSAPLQPSEVARDVIHQPIR